jgi:hypothetical protein
MRGSDDGCVVGGASDVFRCESEGRTYFRERFQSHLHLLYLLVH